MLDLPHITLDSRFPLMQETSRSQDNSQNESWLTSNTRSYAFATQMSAERQIENFSDLLAGWDGHDAQPITAAVKHNARLALYGILKYASLQDITPNPNGTISFEWDTELGFAALEIGQTRLSFFVKPKAGSPMFLDAMANDLPNAAVRVGIFVTETLFPPYKTAAPVTYILAPIYERHTY